MKEFAGWDAFDELLKYTQAPVQSRFILALIKTGGRSGEVLQLGKPNFKVNRRDKMLYVKDMRLEKRWGTNKDPVTHKALRLPNGKLSTFTKIDYRKDFPIWLDEPLTKEFLSAIDAVDGTYLFKSPYKKHEFYCVNWGYMFLRKITDDLPRPLFNRLGLNQPFRDNRTGIDLAQTIHLWQHYFRAQRASQLRSEYGFTEADLMEYFGWKDYTTALHYSRLGATQLGKKILKAVA